MGGDASGIVWLYTPVPVAPHDAVATAVLTHLTKVDVMAGWPRLEDTVNGTESNPVPVEDGDPIPGWDGGPVTATTLLAALHTSPGGTPLLAAT